MGPGYLITTFFNKSMQALDVGFLLAIRSQVENLGAVHILLVPVGGGGSLNPALASEVISLFEPNLVIPMYYKVPALKVNLGTLSRFLKEMGLEKVDSQEMLKVSRSSLSEETQVVILKPRNSDDGG